MSRRKASIPGLPFDPRERGPGDVVRDRVEQVKAFGRRNERELIGAAVVLVVFQAIAAYQWGVVFIGVPKIPGWLLVGIGVGILAAPWALLFGWFLGRGLYRDRSIPVSVLDPQDGQQNIKRIDPGLWEDLRVFNRNGEERQKSYLEKVSINGVEHYEVDKIDATADPPVALASDMAGRTNIEVRQDRSRLRQIKTDLEEQADAAMDVMVQYTTVLRKQGKAIGMDLIRAVEDMDLPEQDKRLHERISDTIEDNDESEELIDELVDDDDDVDVAIDADEPADIFDRARELERNGADADSTEVPADD